MDEIQMVRTLLDKPAPSEAVAIAGRDRLRAETGPPGGAASASRGRSRRFRPHWSVAGLGLTGLAAVVAVAVAVSTSGTTSPTPVPFKSHAPTQPPPSARQILLAAAVEVQKAPKTGAY